MSSNPDYYDGSRFFKNFADYIGVQRDLVNFLFCQILALFLASLYRSVLHPSKCSASIRHTFALVLGLFFGYFCFGQQAIHIALLPIVSYFVIRVQNPEIVQRSVMIVALFYLLCIHLHRQIYDYGSYALDISGPLMIIVQKVTSLAFSIHDGYTKKEKDMTQAQRYYAVYQVPTALEFFSFVLHFQGILAGPMLFYRDYEDFIGGYKLLEQEGSKQNVEKSTGIVIEPSPTAAVIKKVLGSAICALIFMKFIKIYPIQSIKDDEFLNHTSFFYKLWYVMMATTIVRFKYYHAWLLADAICNNSGLGFAGYDKDGTPKWNLFSNIHVLSFEFATNMRNAINNWNIGTNRWLRTIVYERAPKKYGTLLTFALSAVWHGFYPGYYITFATGALIVEAGRVARRLFRYRFQSTQAHRIFYDILTCLTTRVVMGYTTFPFVFLEFMGSFNVYLKLYMCLHIAAALMIFVFPLFLKGEPRSENSNKIKMNTRQERSNETPSLNIVNNLIVTNRLSPISTSSGREAVKVKHDDCEMDNLSLKLKEKIDAETKNIEDFIDKTVSGIVELKDDLMRTEYIFIKENLRKRTKDDKQDDVDKFLKKEIDAIKAVQIPAGSK